MIKTSANQNLLTVRIETSDDAITYNPAQFRTQSRVFQEETREVAEGERIRFTRYDK
jgi:hypothetical protein